MNNLFRIAGRDFKSYFVSPTGYVVLSLFCVLEGWFFFGHVQRFNDLVSTALMSQRADVIQQVNLQKGVIEPLLKNIFQLLMVFLPAISMRMMAEEKKQKTLELLLTSPLTTVEIVGGKFLSGIYFLVLMLGLTLLHPILLFVFGNPVPDVLPIVCGYAGLLLAGCALLAMGLFASCLTENQIVAFIVAASLAQFFVWIGTPAPALGGGTGAFLRALSLQDHTGRLIRAFIDTRSLIYLVSFSIFWLYLSHRTVEASRFR